ncbi:MAG: cytochrome c [Myxococcales bacterium]|nr:cytochrome c [Myxococcales bacterium]
MRRLLFAVLFWAGCERDPTQPRHEFLPEMVDSVAYDSFAPNPVTRDGKTLLAPAKGTIPRGHQPLHYGKGKEEAERAGRELENPLPAGEKALARGAEAYGVFCFPCHGKAGQGDGPVAGKFPTPPSLSAERAKALPDGQLFHIISRGQGVMPPHASQVSPEDRWRIVHHLRELQKAAPAAAGGAR